MKTAEAAVNTVRSLPERAQNAKERIETAKTAGLQVLQRVGSTVKELVIAGENVVHANPDTIARNRIQEARDELKKGEVCFSHEDVVKSCYDTLVWVDEMRADLSEPTIREDYSAHVNDRTQISTPYQIQNRVLRDIQLLAHMERKYAAQDNEPSYFEFLQHTFNDYDAGFSIRPIISDLVAVVDTGLIDDEQRKDYKQVANWVNTDAYTQTF